MGALLCHHHIGKDADSIVAAPVAAATGGSKRNRLLVRKLSQNYSRVESGHHNGGKPKPRGPFGQAGGKCDAATLTNFSDEKGDRLDGQLRGAGDTGDGHICDERKYAQQKFDISSPKNQHPGTDKNNSASKFRSTGFVSCEKRTGPPEVIPEDDEFEYRRAVWYGGSTRKYFQHRKETNLPVTDIAGRLTRVRSTVPLRKKSQWYSQINGGLTRQESFAYKDSAWFGGAGSVKGLVRHYETQEPSVPPDLPRNEIDAARGAQSLPNVSYAEKRRDLVHRPSAPALSSNTGSNSSNTSEGTHREAASKSDMVAARIEDHPFPFADIIPPPPEFCDPPGVEPTAPPLTAPICKAPSLPSAPPPPPPPSQAIIPETRDLPPPPPSWLDPIPEVSQEDASNSPEDDSSSPFPPSDSLSPTDLPVRPILKVLVGKEIAYEGVGEADGTLSAPFTPVKVNSHSKVIAELDAAFGKLQNRINNRSSSTLPSVEKPFKPWTEIPGDQRSPSRAGVRTAKFGTNRNYYDQTDVYPLETRRVLSASEQSFERYQEKLNGILRDEGDGDVRYADVGFPQPQYVAPIPERAARQAPRVQKKAQIAASTPHEPRLAPSQAGCDYVDLLDSKRTLHFESNSGSSGLSSIPSPNRTPKRNAFGPRKDYLMDEIAVLRRRGDVLLSSNGERGYEYRSTISLKTSDLSRYTITQTKKELRTGRSITKRREVYGSGVTQRILVDTDPRSAHYGQASFEDTLQSVSYDYSDDSES